MADDDVNTEDSDDDTLAGRAGRDTFVFAPGHGNDTITGFTDGEDLIDLSAFSGIAGFQNLAITSDESGVTIDITEYGGGTIRLEGFDIADLDSSDFVFAPIEGTDGNDELIGGVDGDVIFGLAGDDRLFGAAGSDSIDGGAGDDEIHGGAGADWIWGDAGDDTIYGGEGDDKIEGGPGDDTLKGGLGDDWLGGGDGADELRGGEGNDILVGDAGDDTLYGDAGDDELYGGAGDDWLHGGTGDDRIEGDAGDDKLLGGGGDDRISGGEGADWIEGQAGDDTLTGGGGADTFVFLPGDGKDTITDFADGEDKIDLSGFASISGFRDLSIDADDNGVTIDLADHGGGTIFLEGFSQQDLDASDFIFSEGWVFGTEEADKIQEKVMNVRIHGLGGDDAVSGWHGDDVVSGGAGDDSLHGGAGSDTLYGGADDDILVGNAGDDTLYGGAGTDSFVFGIGNGSDTIKDFRIDEDVISLSNFNIGPDGTVIDSFDDLTLSEGANGVTLDLGEFGGGTVLIEGVTLEELGPEHFKLHGATHGATFGDDTITGTNAGEDLRGFGGDDTIYGGQGDDRLLGDGDDDTLYGGAGDDTLYGGEGDDTLHGEAGDDSLEGGSGADTFVFGPGGGNDTVKDFTDGEDLIDLSAITGVTAFGNLTMTADGDDTVIDLTAYGGGTIRLENVALTDLDAENFSFFEPSADPGLEGV